MQFCLLICDLSQVQRRSGVRHRCYVGFSSPADTDATADAGSDDHKQPQNGSSAGTAGGGMYTHTHTQTQDCMNHCGSHFAEPGQRSLGLSAYTSVYIHAVIDLSNCCR